MDYINPRLDLAQIEQTLKRDGRVLIRDFFVPEVAESLARTVEAIDWSLTYRDTEGDRRLSGPQLRSLTPQQRMQLSEGITHVARHEFQFSFFTDSLAEALQRGDTDLLARLMRWMADDAFLSVMRRLSGDEAINRVYAQATMYTRGNFLSAHDDHVDAEDRRLAYVINLTRQWRPDWGGLLHFSAPDGAVTDTFYPHFNSLSLFTVPQTHFVSYVPPFAQGERNAITGWLIAA
ncbi:2OG-Fe(II) oxygenase [Roseateles violae]|uniref:2OG-Fe(II) oxygenase family protein n=1 Tax=Roseateles violae TaxID=3058042 RepID=A0ABT8DUU3_9BURK|nr:2OG-Fe(II) oxygenase family protein [Pelomonas sp. PFR6]MDN3922059.1 2OG-Fe(II) oxygenase family protein [Pelomonas sp. PFR6]